MEENLNLKINEIINEFMDLTNQQAYFLAGEDIDNFNVELSEESCSRFCYEISKSEVGNYLCTKKRQALVNSAYERKESAIAVCHVGLYEIMVPVFSGGKLLGMFSTSFSHSKLEGNIKDQIDLYQNKYSITADVLIDSLSQITVIETNAIHNIENLLQSLILLRIPQNFKSKENYELTGSNNLDFPVENENIASTPIHNMPYSSTIDQQISVKGGYQAVDDILEKFVVWIFMDIRTGKLVKAKEAFKKLMNPAYLEDDLNKGKYAALFFIFRINDHFLRKISNYKEVYDLMVPILNKISSAENSRQIRELANEYFDGMVTIYQITDQNRNAIINRIVSYVKDNYMHHFTIKDMTNSLNVSTSYASRIFSDQMGESIKGYINEIRMYHAQHYLRYTDWKISIIAEKVGYPDVRSFYKMFEKHFGISCSQLRRFFFNATIDIQE